MKLLLLLLALLAVVFAGEESCMDRCENGFESEKTCQCDSMCRYYRSCCSDYHVICRMNTRGDTFVLPEDDEELPENTPTPAPALPQEYESGFGSRSQMTQTGSPTANPSPATTPTTSQNPATTTGPVKSQDAVGEQRVVSPDDSSAQPTPVSQSVSTTQRVLRVPGTLVDPVTTAAPMVTTATTQPAPTTTQAPDPDAEVCSGRAFDSLMQMKNGSIYAFRGDYFFELGQKSVMPGYPKRIKDVWGISGPIDAAFTRVNCLGKTYIFKGNQYWRFDDGVLDEDYPRDISVGFDKIPDHVDAAFALPAQNHHGKEKVYFFKGDQYYYYEFLHQPSHGECMSQTSPSTPFSRYIDMYISNYEQFFRELFADMPRGHGGHHFINKDWKGLKSPVDAVLAGRIYVAPWVQRPDQRRDQQWNQQYQQFGQQWNQQYQQYSQQWDQQYGRRRQKRSPSWESFAERGMGMGQSFAEKGMDMGLRLAERGMEMEERLGRSWDRRHNQDWDQDRRRYDSRNFDFRFDRNDRDYWEFLQRSQPLQSVYFFKGDKYYRVDLKTKRVDPARPPYPRSIAKYWLGCSDTPRQEKK